MKPLLIFDQDGVLTNLSESFIKRANELSGKEVIDPSEGGETWRFEDYYTDEIISKTFSDPDVWLNAKPFNDYMALFMSNIDRSIVCSSPANAVSAACKYEWLTSHGISRKKFVLAVDKTCLARPGAILIDDNASNCADFVRSGGQAILVMRHYSKSFRKEDVSLAMQNHVNSAAELAVILSKL